MNPYYKDYSEYLNTFFPGRKIQKISINAGFNCPNRDGRIGTGGCIYCSNRSFTPDYCFINEKVESQLEQGKSFFRKKYPEMQYIAYFQSYTNTYDKAPEELRKLYETALSVNDVVGISIATRPDCITRDALELMAEINFKNPLFVELGVETLNDRTLKVINRGHTSDDTRQAIKILSEAGLHIGVHLINGLPGESFSDCRRTLKEIISLPVESVKMHHLQVLRGTTLEKKIKNGEMEFRPLELEDYLNYCVEVVKTVPRHIAIERFLASAPSAEVVSPKWGLKNYEFVSLLHKKLEKSG